MNYKLLDKMIAARRLPDDAGSPRAKLYELIRALEELREHRTRMADEMTGDDLAALNKQIEFYEQLLET